MKNTGNGRLTWAVLGALLISGGCDSRPRHRHRRWRSRQPTRSQGGRRGLDIQQLEATGGTGSYVWSTVGGAWPMGVELTLNGLVLGAPGDSGVFGVTVRVTSGDQTADRGYSLTIDGSGLLTWGMDEFPTPFGFALYAWVRVDPEDDDTWYAGGNGGLHVTNDAGETWTQTMAAFLPEPVEFDPGDSSTLFAVPIDSVGQKLVRSVDRGLTWTTLYEVPVGSVVSFHIGRSTPGLILLGAAIDPKVDPVPDRFYRSSDYGATWSVQPIDGGSRGLIPWDIEEDINGMLYSGTEIYDHPQPYRAPFFRSRDDGLTWEKVTGILPWHVIAIQPHPSIATIYALTEGAGLYMTTDGAVSWTRVSTGSPFPSHSLLIDPLAPSRLYGGRARVGSSPGGVYASSDGGQTFQVVGLTGSTVGSLSLAQHSRVLIAAAIWSGIWRATIPIQP